MQGSIAWLFGVIDLLSAIWTWLALKKDEAR